MIVQYRQNPSKNSLKTKYRIPRIPRIAQNILTLPLTNIPTKNHKNPRE